MNRIILSPILVLGGAAVFVLGNPYYAVFPTNGNQAYYVALVLVFLVVSVVLRRSQSLSRYWPVAYSFFIASAALLFFSTRIFNIPRDGMGPLQDLAVDKFSQFLHIVPVIVGLTLLAQKDLGSIFIKRGDLRRSLIFGLVSFAVFAPIAYITQQNSRELFSSLPTAIPWILLFIFSNSIMEELWFRGIFLREYESLIGRNGAIIVTAALFGASHVSATYDFLGGGIVFGLVVFVLGLLGARSMLKHDGWIGPVLFHAAYDLLVIVPVLNS
jgi:membrane protease YdiL (CAAX protease family)